MKAIISDQEFEALLFSGNFRNIEWHFKTRKLFLIFSNSIENDQPFKKVKTDYVDWKKLIPQNQLKGY